MKNFKEFMEDVDSTESKPVENRADVARKRFAMAKDRSIEMSSERKKEALERAKKSSSAVKFDNRKVVHSKSQLRLPGGNKKQKPEE